MSLARNVLFWGSALGVGLALSFLVAKPFIDDSRFRRAYENALMIYADTNRDGLVSSSEQDAFDIDLLKDKNVTLLPHRMPQYKDGSEVPTSTVTQWIREYTPSK